MKDCSRKLGKDFFVIFQKRDSLFPSSKLGKVANGWRPFGSLSPGRSAAMAGRSTSVPRKRIDQTHPPDEETAVCTSFFVSRFVSFRFVFFYFFFRCFSSVRRFPPLAFRRRAGAATGGFPGGLSFSPIWHYNNRRLFLWENKDLGKSGHRCWFTRVRWHSMTLHFIYLEETEIKKKSLTQSQ